MVLYQKFFVSSRRFFKFPPILPVMGRSGDFM
nr:MAG TPA: hypothetical protein [Caudoviricetes sp.]